MSVPDVKRMLKEIARDMRGSSPERLTAMLYEVDERITRNATTFEAEIFFRISPAKSGERVASPRGFEPRLSP